MLPSPVIPLLSQTMFVVATELQLQVRGAKTDHAGRVGKLLASSPICAPGLFRVPQGAQLILHLARARLSAPRAQDFVLHRCDRDMRAKGIGYLQRRWEARVQLG